MIPGFVVSRGRRCGWTIALASVTLLGLSAFESIAQNPPAAATSVSNIGVHNGSLTDPDIRYIGRWDKSNQQVYHGYWGGVYLRTGFTGTTIGINLAEATGLAVSIDGEPMRMLSGGPGITPLTTSPLKPGRHLLMVGSSNQNYEVSFQGLILEPGAVTLPVPERPIIEIVGDSISIGVGDGYGWTAGEMLGCDHVQIAFSARALTSGYGCVDNKTGLDVQYFRLKNFNHLKDNSQPLWDFSYTPKIIVINLGQNDQCGREPAASMTASYTGFLQKLRIKFPQAYLVALRPFGGAYADAIHQAVTARQAAGDNRVTFVDTTGWVVNADDFRDGIHPNAVGNLKAAWHLADALFPLLN